VHNHSSKLVTTIEFLAYIPCVVVGEILNASRRFQVEGDDIDFQELLSLYTTNSNMLREFAVLMISTFMFPLNQEK